MGFQIRNETFCCKIKEAKGLCGDVHGKYVVQSILQADEETAKKGHFWLETSSADSSQ